MKKKNNKLKREEVVIKYVRGLIIRCMVVVIIFLGMAIISRTSSKYKDIIIKNVYEDNISFVKIKKLYDKYLGGINPLEKVGIEDVMVFNEELAYEDISIYHDGAKLIVNNNYLVPVQSEGMVIFIGEKENYGNVIIIEGVDGIDTWYGNMNKTSVKLYDYVDKGTYLGTTKGDTLYLVYQQEGVFLDYKEFIK